MMEGSLFLALLPPISFKYMGLEGISSSDSLPIFEGLLAKILVKFNLDLLVESKPLDMSGETEFSVILDLVILVLSLCMNPVSLSVTLHLQIR